MGRSCTSKGAIKHFAKQWSFVHTTSSPRHAQSNGFAERTVQTVKNTIRKAKMDERDPELALLCLRTTPISGKIRSPIEMLMGRKAKANLPISMRNQPADSEQTSAALRDRQVSQKSTYDSRVGAELPQLYAGQHVRFQYQPSGNWMPARIVRETDEPRSYLLETSNGTLLRRSRHHIAETPPLRAPVVEQQQSPRRVRFLEDALPEPAPPDAMTTREPTTAPADASRDGFSRYGCRLKKTHKLNLWTLNV